MCTLYFARVDVDVVVQVVPKEVQRVMSDFVIIENTQFDRNKKCERLPF